MKKLYAFLILGSIAASASAQVITNKFISPECATWNNNGTDLRGFITSNKSDLYAKGGKILDYSNSNWGYVQVKNAKVPSQDKKGELNYYQSFDATLLLQKTKDGGRATWWSRQYNMSNQPIVYLKVGADKDLGLENVKYTDITRELETKVMTVIEQFTEVANPRDFEVMFKNCLFVRSGVIKSETDLRPMYSFYNKFLGKFQSFSDPMLENKSFVTFWTGGDNKYIGYFNVVNGKLSGRLEIVDGSYEKDQAKLINDIFKDLTGSTVCIYGDNTFGLDRFITKKADAKNLKLVYKTPSDSRLFNEEQ